MTNKTDELLDLWEAEFKEFMEALDTGDMPCTEGLLLRYPKLIRLVKKLKNLPGRTGRF